MNATGRLIERYLRQVAELGGPELFLESCTAAEMRAAVRRAAAPAGSSRAVPAGPRPARLPSSGADPARLETLKTLARAAATCTKCRLHSARQRAVFGEGNPSAEVVVVGEAPGQEEDRSGRPFVGRAGKMLDLMLMAVGFPREHVYICNVLKCRPPNNRNPMPDEVETCTTHFLHAQLEAIAPRILLAIGRFAVQALLGTDEAIGRLRGRIHAYRGTPVIVSYHPAFLLRSPQMTRAAWDDLQLLRTVLDEQY